MFVPTSMMCRGRSARTRIRSICATSGSAMGWLCSAAYCSMRASSASRGGVSESRYSAWVRWRILSMPAFMGDGSLAETAPYPKTGLSLLMGYRRDVNAARNLLIAKVVLVSKQSLASCAETPLTDLRILENDFAGGLDRLKKASSASRVLSLIERSCFDHLRLGGGIEDDTTHLKRRRSRSNTSSAGMPLVRPSSKSLRRRPISSVQAFS